MLQTTLVCARSVPATLGLPPFHGIHSSGSRLLHWERFEAGPGLHAPPRSKPLRLTHSGSPQRRRLVGPVFCALPRSEHLR